jgi:hypothetical protein
MHDGPGVSINLVGGSSSPIISFIKWFLAARHKSDLVGSPMREFGDKGDKNGADRHL